MSDPFEDILLDLSRLTERVSKEIGDEDSFKSSTPVILHPRVWKDEEEAKKAATDSNFRTKMELLKQLEDKMRV